MKYGYDIRRENLQKLIDTAVPFLARKTLKMAALPDVVDRSSRGWTVRNQMNEGSCTGHMITAAAEDLAFIEAGAVVSLSPDFSYYCAQRRCGLLGSDDGATIEGAREAAELDGFVDEAVLPYSPKYDPDKVTDAVRLKAKGRIKRHSVPLTPEEWQAWIGSGQGGNLMGVPWTRELANYAGTSVVKDLGSVRNAAGWHAIYNCGYSLRMNEGELVFQVKNSHSSQYGREGYLYFTLRVARQLVDAGATVISVSDIEDWENPVVRSAVRSIDPFAGT